MVTSLQGFDDTNTISKRRIEQGLVFLIRYMFLTDFLSTVEYLLQNLSGMNIVKTEVSIIRGAERSEKRKNNFVNVHLISPIFVFFCFCLNKKDSCRQEQYFLGVLHQVKESYGSDNRQHYR